MALNFPNTVRSFDEGRNCVSFWGSDASLEITFQIGFEALHKLRPEAEEGEAPALETFDRNRGVILAAAAHAYGKHRGPFHRLTAADFQR